MHCLPKALYPDTLALLTDLMKQQKLLGLFKKKKRKENPLVNM